MNTQYPPGPTLRQPEPALFQPAPVERRSVSPARLALCVLATAVIFSACATTSSSQSAQEEQRDLSAYLPLALGNSWTYERTFLGEKGEDTVQIMKQQDGYFVDNHGNALTVDAFGIRDPKRYLLRNPIESGRTWNTVVSASSMEHYKILDAGFDCDAPAGRFNDCVRVESRNRIDKAKTMVNEITFAPGIGMVRLEFFLDTDQKRIPQGQMLLKTFALKNAAASAK